MKVRVPVDGTFIRWRWLGKEEEDQGEDTNALGVTTAHFPFSLLRQKPCLPSSLPLHLFFLKGEWEGKVAAGGGGKRERKIDSLFGCGGEGRKGLSLSRIHFSKDVTYQTTKPPLLGTFYYYVKGSKKKREIYPSF